mmetsp:Transcript_11093/g.29762  ORF Transcript_11093/g.29762 Transcript_11093/m.29762 type:complete len:376 (-) Transcript_11093:414-1541(-)
MGIEELGPEQGEGQGPTARHLEAREGDHARKHEGHDQVQRPGRPRHVELGEGLHRGMPVEGPGRPRARDRGQHRGRPAQAEAAGRAGGALRRPQGLLVQAVSCHAVLPGPPIRAVSLPPPQPLHLRKGVRSGVRGDSLTYSGSSAFCSCHFLYGLVIDDRYPWSSRRVPACELHSSVQGNTIPECPFDDGQGFHGVFRVLLREKGRPSPVHRAQRPRRQRAAPLRPDGLPRQLRAGLDCVPPAALFAQGRADALRGPPRRGGARGVRRGAGRARVRDVLLRAVPVQADQDQGRPPWAAAQVGREGIRALQRCPRRTRHLDVSSGPRLRAAGRGGVAAPLPAVQAGPLLVQGPVWPALPAVPALQHLLSLQGPHAL